MLKPIRKPDLLGDESAYIFAALGAGVDAGKLTRELVSRQPNNPTSLNRLVDIASVHVWLAEGAPIADVLTVLVVRHRFHLSSADCRTYATEILWAAQHQIEAAPALTAFQTERSTIMPLLEIVQTAHVNTTIRLDESTAIQVDQYAAFLHASADEVVDKALAYVFAKDRDFQEFLRAPEAAHVPRSLRVRRMQQSGAGSEPAKSTAKAARPVEAVHDSRPRS